MPWDDAAELESRLNRALNFFNWEAADAVCDEIIERTSKEAETLPERSARKLLASLRAKGRFGAMTRLGRALLQSGLRTAAVRRQYAQGLIEEGLFYEAEQELNSIINDSRSVPRDVAEAKGLLGRHHKQLYVNAADPSSPRARAHLERALKEYEEGYRLNPYENYWHGINVVALAARARRDAAPVENLPDPAARAEEVVATLDQREADGIPVTTWEEATRLEAYVALARHKDALDTALRYLDCADTNAFELQSTVRQLRQVWQLSESEPPGNRLLPLLHSAHLAAVGGAFELDAKRVAREAAAASEAEADEGFQALLGTTKMQKLRWYRKGLAQCAAVARVEVRGEGDGVGTGWLVRAEDFFPGWTGVLVLTNDHVVSVTPREDGRPVNPRSLRPEKAQVNFQVTGEVFDVDSIVLSSYYRDGLDYAFLRLRGDGVPQAAPLVLHDQPVAMPLTTEEPPPRMYVIGHPNGRDLEIGLQDNLLIACNDRLLHYRTPTEPGNSGSPVFEPTDWRVVGLHHKGSKTLARLDDPQLVYEANEGVSIRAIQEETRRAALTPPATPPGGTPREVNPPF